MTNSNVPRANSILRPLTKVKTTQRNHDKTTWLKITC